MNSMSLINQNELNIMATLSEMIILSCWLLFIVSRFPHLIISANIMTEQKGKGYQGRRATEAFGYENASDFKYCYY